MKNLGSFFLRHTSREHSPQKCSVHVEDTFAVSHLADYLSQSLYCSEKKGLPIIMCIGTDRSTGDSLGPLTGWQLTNLLKHQGLPIYGTLENPVHAVNLAETLDKLRLQECNSPIIAVDACLGRVSPVGSIIAQREPLQPGIGINKNLPAVGDISISGIVNVGGYMEFQVLQNTRLNLVFKMSRIIAHSIYWAIQRNYPHLSGN